MRRLIFVLATALGVLAASGCGQSQAGQSGGGQHGGPEVKILARRLHGAGMVLVTTKGYALYMFQPDGQRQVTCTGACAGSWPPVKIAAGATLAAGHGVSAALLGSDPDPEGGRVVTYKGWPLYTYSGDVEPGQTTGQAIDLNGGEWYLMRPSGRPLTPSPLS